MNEDLYAERRAQVKAEIAANRHERSLERKRERDAAWARKNYTPVKVARREAAKAAKAERPRIRNEKKAEKQRIAAEKLAAKSKPGPVLQAKLDAYQAGLACGWERGRQYERTNGKDAVTPETL